MPDRHREFALRAYGAFTAPPPLGVNQGTLNAAT
jgi:hypothetical protein